MRHFENPAPQQATVPWSIGGETIDGEEWTETFTSLCKPPAGVLNHLGQAIQVIEGTVYYLQVPSILFIRGTLVPGDEQRWDELMVDKNRLVLMDPTVGRIVDYLTEVVAHGRPTGPLLDSAGGSQAAVDTSTDG